VTFRSTRNKFFAWAAAVLFGWLHAINASAVDGTTELHSQKDSEGNWTVRQTSTTVSVSDFDFLYYYTIGVSGASNIWGGSANLRAFSWPDYAGPLSIQSPWVTVGLFDYVVAGSNHFLWGNNGVDSTESDDSCTVLPFYGCAF
jgi:hypothetical protein